MPSHFWRYPPPPTSCCFACQFHSCQARNSSDFIKWQRTPTALLLWWWRAKIVPHQSDTGCQSRRVVWEERWGVRIYKKNQIWGLRPWNSCLCTCSLKWTLACGCVLSNCRQMLSMAKHVNSHVTFYENIWFRCDVWQYNVRDGRASTLISLSKSKERCSGEWDCRWGRGQERETKHNESWLVCEMQILP